MQLSVVSHYAPFSIMLFIYNKKCTFPIEEHS